MTTFKDILYKKNDDETWVEWTKRVPDNDEDKLDYIGETIHDISFDSLHQYQQLKNQNFMKIKEQLSI